jgi:hypothetical protein
MLALSVRPSTVKQLASPDTLVDKTLASEVRKGELKIITGWDARRQLSNSIAGANEERGGLGLHSDRQPGFGDDQGAGSLWTINQVLRKHLLLPVTNRVENFILGDKV